jgi:hypothetical protein
MNEIEPFSFAIDEIFDRKYTFKIQNTDLHSNLSNVRIECGLKIQHFPKYGR